MRVDTLVATRPAIAGVTHFRLFPTNPVGNSNGFPYFCSVIHVNDPNEPGIHIYYLLLLL
jgi:hypothetical protein